MTENVVRVETLYTYEAAVNRYERERHYDWLCRQKRLKEIKREQQEKRTYFCNQKLLGGMWIILVCVLSILIGNPIGLVLAIPGIAIVATKKMVIVNNYYWTHSGTEQWKGR